MAVTQDVLLTESGDTLALEDGVSFFLIEAILITARVSQAGIEYLVRPNDQAARLSQAGVEYLLRFVTYTLIVTPDPATVLIGMAQQFTARKIGSDGSAKTPAVLWSTNAGTIDGNGKFTPLSSAIGDGFVDHSGTFVPYLVTATEIGG